MHVIVPTAHILRGAPSVVLEEVNDLLTYILQEINENGLDVDIGEIILYYFTEVSRLSETAYKPHYKDFIDIAKNVYSEIMRHVVGLEVKGILALNTTLVSRLGYDVVVFVELVDIRHGVNTTFEQIK